MLRHSMQHVPKLQQMFAEMGQQHCVMQEAFGCYDHSYKTAVTQLNEGAVSHTQRLADV